MDSVTPSASDLIIPPPAPDLPHASVEMENAGFFYRLVAFMIDGTALMVINVVLAGGPSLMIGLFLGLSEQSAVIASAIWQTLVTVITMVYYVWMHGARGQTVGKATLRIKVVNLDGTPISYEQAALRYAPFLVLGLLTTSLLLVNPGLGLLMAVVWALWIPASVVCMFVNKDKRTIHDLIAKTKVIKL